ncbi:hypothetical protein L6452_07209 [Arctium lappa]|uniref:Uncharacterized protein n=1 Tax=Arctium lappa TaxID=4217 RepID=A0ACB9EL57_ARCLA|nr:hypothetical protein L6452_07209 [Arctium lappa]
MIEAFNLNDSLVKAWAKPTRSELRGKIDLLCSQRSISMIFFDVPSSPLTESSRQLMNHMDTKNFVVLVYLAAAVVVVSSVVVVVVISPATATAW